MPSQSAAFLAVTGPCSITLSLTSVASTPVSPSSAGSMQSMRVANLSTDNGYILISSPNSSVTSATSATTAAVYASMPVIGRQVEVFSCPPNALISGLTTAAALAVTLVVTAGYGLK